MRQTCSDLRTDKMRLTSQITELQNQNAQLIEDHTRDVLQIKAKETQLVRARSDAETAEDRANSLSREIDRLKREITRLGRNQAGRDSPVDNSLSNGASGDYSSAPRPAYGSSKSYNIPSSASRGYSNPHAENGYGEGKENIPDGRDEYGSKLNSSALPNSRPGSARPMSNGSETPNEEDSGMGRSGGSSHGGERGGPGLARSQSEGVESWRRAAEVTQNLKARIEMMKVCLSFSSWSTTAW